MKRAGFFDKGYNPLYNEDPSTSAKRKVEVKGGAKGNEVRFATFLAWEKVKNFGYDTKTVEGIEVVVFAYCKVCRRHEDALRKRSHLKGTALESSMAFSKGTASVTKYQVSRRATRIFRGQGRFPKKGTIFR